MDVCVKNNYRYSKAQARDSHYGIKLKLFHVVDMYLKIIWILYNISFKIWIINTLDHLTIP